MFFPKPRTLILCGVLLITMTGCITGERPTLVPAPTVDDPAAIAVIDRLEQSYSVDFIATYRIAPTASVDEAIATVSQLGDRRRVKIGSVIYTVDGPTSQTCSLETERCVDFLDDAFVSDLNVTNAFWGPAFQTRLENDANGRIGPTTGTSTSIAGFAALCVDVIVAGAATTSATVVYCALDAGVLARYIGADVTIELTDFSYEVSSNDLE